MGATDDGNARRQSRFCIVVQLLSNSSCTGDTGACLPLSTKNLYTTLCAAYMLFKKDIVAFSYYEKLCSHAQQIELYPTMLYPEYTH